MPTTSRLERTGGGHSRPARRRPEQASAILRWPERVLRPGDAYEGIYDLPKTEREAAHQDSSHLPCLEALWEVRRQGAKALCRGEIVHLKTSISGPANARAWLEERQAQAPIDRQSPRRVTRIASRGV